MPSLRPDYFEYFLNHKNHKPGIPLDMISYHFYATPTAGQNIDNWQYTFFDQADGFLHTVRYAEAIRKRLSPETMTTLDELGVILASDDGQDQPGHVEKPIPDGYWNLAGAMYAHLYVEVAKLGIDVAGESQLVGYPSQFPSVTMVDWKNGHPNARFWVLKLLKDNFGPGDQLAHTEIPGNNDVQAQAFSTKGRQEASADQQAKQRGQHDPAAGVRRRSREQGGWIDGRKSARSPRQPRAKM